CTEYTTSKDGRAGPHHRPGQFLFDVSDPSGPPDVRAWNSTLLQPVTPVSCPGPSGFYWSAAEPAPGVCLMILHNGEILRNGVSVHPASYAMFWGDSFRMAAGGRWTIPVTRRAVQRFYPAPLSLPMFDSTGTPKYYLNRFYDVPGADFSPDGDTLF